MKHKMVSSIPVLELFEKGMEKTKLPTVVFYHGWESRKERVLEQGYFLAENGFRAILPEASLHGERKLKGVEEHHPTQFWNVIINSVKEFPAMVNYYIENGLTDKETIGVAGLSMGGITANALLTQYDWIHSAAILMASPSPIELSKWLLTQYEKNGTPIGSHFSHEELSEKLEELTPISLDKHPEKINHRPLYVWHGTKDQIVPIHFTQQFFQKIKDKEYSKNVVFETTEGVEHEVPQEITLRMVDFFKQSV